VALERGFEGGKKKNKQKKSHDPERSQTLEGEGKIKKKLPVMELH